MILGIFQATSCSVLHSLAKAKLLVWRWPRALTASGCFELKMKIKKPKTNGALASFNAQAFLDTAGVARKVMDYRRGESIYSQGEAAETVMYIQKGGVKLSVVNGSGKEAVVAMFGPGAFFGEGCMAGQTLRMEPARERSLVEQQFSRKPRI